jgi:uncharacterized membrane protein YciS (DUF1049 family)
LLRKIAAAIVLVPLAIVIVAFAVANRQEVTVSFDPFSADKPVAAVTLPLFALTILLLIIGVVIGGAASWLRQGRWRASVRRLERELRRLRDRLGALEGTTAKPAAGTEQGAPRPRLRAPLR